MKYFVGWNDKTQTNPFAKHPFKAIPLNDIQEQFWTNGGGVVDKQGEIYTGGTPDIWSDLEGSIFDQVPDLERFWSEFNAAHEDGNHPCIGDEIAGAIFTCMNDDEKEALRAREIKRARDAGFDAGVEAEYYESPENKLESFYFRILKASISAGVTPDRASESSSYLAWALSQIIQLRIKEDKNNERL